MWALGIGAILLAVLAGGAAVATSMDEKVDSRGVCPTEPFRIAQAHGVSLDVEALARMMMSEAGTSKSRRAVGWAARNYARRKGESISTILLRGRLKNGTPSSSEGKFGAQNTGKYVSTRTPSTTDSRKDAAAILAGSLPDPTDGSTQWDAPAAQDALVGKVTGYTKTSAEVAAERSKTSVLVMADGVSNIRFWRPKGVA
jgi:hypothetical protein